ncbi:MAG: restriction endonuclease subunit S [Lachnospiraceae bacterium]|nr:restriction endonuclease subunit S [Lachnospiraceae bacterium]
MKCIEDEIPFDVPDGWAWCRLHNIYNFIDYRGATPTKLSSGVPLITAKNVKSGYIDYSIDEYISEEEYQERQQRGISHKGDILFTTEAPLGNAALADIEKFSAGQRLITFQNYNAAEISLYNELFLYFILSNFFQDELHEKKTGTTVAGIKAAILKTLWIPVPPYNEQIKIAKAIRKYIQSIDEIANNVEDLTDVVSVAKNKILDLAIRGKLIPQNNNEPASVLLQRIRSEKEELIKQGKLKRDKKESIIYKGDDNSYYEKISDGTISCIDADLPFEIPYSWAWERLRNLFIINPKNNADDNTPVSFIPMALLEDGFSGNYTYEKKLWKECKKGFTHFAVGDVCFAKISPCFENRKSAYFKELSNNMGSGTTELYVLRRYTNDIMGEYLLSFLKSEYFISRGNNTFSGVVGQQRVDKEIMLDTFIPIPPSQEQLRINNILGKLFSELKNIEDSIK